MTPSSIPLSSATRASSAASKSSSPRIAASVTAATFGLDPGIVGQFVDAFDGDHRRIHVGDEQRLSAVRGGLDDDVVFADQAFERGARLGIDRRANGRSNALALVEPDRRPSRSAPHSAPSARAASSADVVAETRLLSASR